MSGGAVLDWSKAKNLIILLLALVNVFLLGNIAYLLYKNEAAARNTVAELVAYLEARGVSLEADAVPRENLGRTVLVVERDTELEAASARVLLDDQSLSAAADGLYASTAGELSVKAGGYLDARLTSDAGARALVSLIEKSGVSLSATEHTNDTAEMQVAYAELPVFNCRLTASREGDAWTVSGRICVGNALRTDAGTERDVPGLIVAVAQRLILRGTTEITQIEAGWVAGSISNVGLRLIPVYKLMADTDDFYVNAVDGTLLSVE